MRISSFIPTAIMLATFGMVLFVVWAARAWMRQSGRRSPFTKDMLRGPGHTLREKIDDLSWDVAGYFTMAPLVPLLMYATYLQERISGEWPSAADLVIYFVGSAIGLAFIGSQLIRTMLAIRRNRFGLEAEAAAAEELNRLMQHGCTVFHDVPGDGPFNLDHIIVGPPGVFAVETKGRMKRINHPGNDGHIVKSDGVVLGFPGWSERKPIEQATRNAKWLARWLSSATGEPVFVNPVVVLPGWFVKRTAPTGVPVFNADEARSFLVQRHDVVLTNDQVRRICHQLDQRCRTVQSRMEGARRKAI